MQNNSIPEFDSPSGGSISHRLSRDYQATAGNPDNIREAFQVLARFVNSCCLDCREKSLALTKIEEGMFWAGAALSRNKRTAPAQFKLRIWDIRVPDKLKSDSKD